MTLTVGGFKSSMACERMEFMCSCRIFESPNAARLAGENAVGTSFTPSIAL